MELKNKKVLVTGGLGAVGSNLIRKLVETYQCEVIVVDDLSSGYDGLGEWKQANVLFNQISILDDEAMKNLFIHNDKDIIFHFATLSSNQKSINKPNEDLMVNGIGTLKMLQYATEYGIEKFVFASTSRVYGDTDTENKEDDKIDPDTPHAMTKLLGEEYCKFFYYYYGLNTIVLRIFNCYGPWDKPVKNKGVIPNFFKSALNKRLLTIYGTGEETRSYIYMEDAIEMIIKAVMSRDAIGEVINIGSDNETKTIDLANKINSLCCNQADNITYIIGKSWDTIKKRKANLDKAQKILNYKPRIGLDEGLRKTYDWFIQHPEVWQDKERENK